MTRKKGPETVVQRFARNVATARAWMRWSQAELAKAVGVDPSYVSLLEAGKRTPDIELAERFAKALHSQLGWLLENVDRPGGRP